MIELLAEQEIAASSWITGGGLAGGLLGVSVFLGPKIPDILKFFRERRDSDQAFEERKKKAEFDAADRVAAALKDVAVAVAEGRATSVTMAANLNDLAREVRLIGEMLHDVKKP